MADRPRTRQYWSSSLERGLAILGAFSEAAPSRSASDLAQELKVSRATLHRYLATLVELGFLARNPRTRSYHLGKRSVDVGLVALNTLEVRMVGRPHAEQLARAVGHTVTLGILDDVEVVEVEKVRASTSIDLNYEIGARFPAYCTAHGKVLLASLPGVALKKVMARMSLVARTPRTIVSKRAFEQELILTRKRGFGVNDEELSAGLRAVAAPVYAESGEAIAAISVSGYASMIPTEELTGVLAQFVREAALAISRDLGFERLEASTRAGR